MSDKKLKIPIQKNCEICKNLFVTNYKNTKTCSKSCKNILAKNITIKQFSNEETRKKHGEITKKAMTSPSIRKSYENGMSKRRSYKKENHPRWGIHLNEDTKKKIGDGNRGKFKGKTWEEMYGTEESNNRKINSSDKMAETNSKLLKERTSNLEKSYLNELSKKGYKNNCKIGKYVVDYLNKQTKHVIEIYGNYWHCNPSLYKENYFNKSVNKYAKDIWDNDNKRIEYLRKIGYSVDIIWEKNYENRGI